MSIPEFSFLDNYLYKSESSVHRNMVEEIISMYGWPCIHYRFLGNKLALDPLYGDAPTHLINDETVYEKINTKVYIEWKQFNQILTQSGAQHDNNIYLDGIMKLNDSPKEDDILSFLYPLDGNTYNFRLSTTDVFKDICYRVYMLVYLKDVN